MSFRKNKKNVKKKVIRKINKNEEFVKNDKIRIFEKIEKSEKTNLEN